MKALPFFLVATLIVSPVAWAQTKPPARAETPKLGTTKTGKTGSSDETKPDSKPKNLKLVPPWTMKLCPKELHAAYDKAGAIKLRALDNDCWRWRQYFNEYFTMKKSYEGMTSNLRKVIESHERSRTLDRFRIEALTSQLKKEIEEKNEYKYKPTWGWLWAVGGGVALAIATGILIGVFATDSSD
jgi:hypothetical protein